MSIEWNRFLSALEARGLVFRQVALASDRRAVIQATGFTDSLSIAIIETEWQRNLSRTNGRDQDAEEAEEEEEDSQALTQQGRLRSTARGRISRVGDVALVHNSPPGTQANIAQAPATRAGQKSKERQDPQELRAGGADALGTTAAAVSANVSRASDSLSLRDYSRLTTLPEEVQDVVVASEVLSAALGVGGTLIPYVSAAASSKSAGSRRAGSAAGEGFTVSSYVSLSMRDLCAAVLPVADAVVALQRVERAEYLGGSLVEMALGEVVSEVVTSYAHQISRLQEWSRRQSMPLMGVVSEVLRVGHHIVRLRQLLPGDILPPSEQAGAPRRTRLDHGSPSSLPSLAGGSGGVRGPRLLNHLTEQVERCAGCREDSEIAQLLLRRALVPYLRMLYRWMRDGVLEDPFGEFFITEAYAPSRPAPTAMTSSSSRLTASSHFPLAPATLDRASSFSGGGGGAGGGGGGNGSGFRPHTDALPSTVSREQQRQLQQQDVVNFERRFALNRLMVPAFLEQPSRVAKLIFFGGKYRCLLREYSGSESGGDAVASAATDLALVSSLSPSGGANGGEETTLAWNGAGELHRRVQESFDATSQSMVRLLFSSSVDIIGHLASIKTYFLHARGDWVVDLLDSANDLLVQSPDKVRAHSVLVLLQAAIARSCGAADRYHGSVGCSFADAPLAQHLAQVAAQVQQKQQAASTGERTSASAFTAPPLFSAWGASGATGMESSPAVRCLDLLQLDVELPWPLSLVINATAIQRFNSIFRLLTWVKVCERALASLWYTNEVLHSFPIAYIIKLQLTQILRQFQFYAAHSVLEPSWNVLLDDIAAADSVFAATTALNTFFSSAETGLVLATPHRFRSLSRILTLSTRFCEMGLRASTATLPLVEATLVSIRDELLSALCDLASPTGEDYRQLVPLLTLIDFSGFYKLNNVYHVQTGAAA